MNADFVKIILGNIFRSLLVALITFLVTKNVLEADVAAKIARGDTVPLWNGTLNLNLAMIINVAAGLAVPIVLPIALGIYSRVKQAYETIVARSESFAQSKEQVKATAAQATIVEKITAVAQT